MILCEICSKRPFVKCEPCILENNTERNSNAESVSANPLLSDVIGVLEKSNDMLADIYCNVDLPNSLYTKDNDIRDRIDANRKIINRCKEELSRQ